MHYYLRHRTTSTHMASDDHRTSMTRRTFVQVGVTAVALGATACGDDADSQTVADAGGTDVGAGDVGVDDAASTDASAPDSAADAAGDADADSATAPDAEVGVRTISIVHVNDLHANYAVGADGSTTFGRIVGFYQQVLAENPHTLFTNGGDDYEKGSVAEVISEGRATLELAKAMAFDVRCIGNHDFAWTVEQMLEYSDDPHADVLCGNVAYTGPEPERWKAKDFVVREVGGVHIGFFGLVSKPWNENNEQYDGDFFPEFPMRHDNAANAREIVDAHRDEVDLMIFVSHLGLGLDVALAGEVDGIDVILGAHSHSVVTPAMEVNGTRIIQAGSSASFVARMDLDVDLGSRELVGYRYELHANLPGVLPTSAEMDATVADVLQRHAPEIDVALGRTRRVRGGTELAALAAQASVAVLEVDAAFVDEGVTWDALPGGGVTQQDFLDGFKVERQPAGTPGFNSMYTAQVSGAELILLRDGLAPSWARAVPDVIDEGATYAVAMTRFGLQNPTRYLPDGVAPADVAPGWETWAVLDAYARQRTAAGLYMDVDEPLDA